MASVRECGRRYVAVWSGWNRTCSTAIGRLPRWPAVCLGYGRVRAAVPGVWVAVWTECVAARVAVPLVRVAVPGVVVAVRATRGRWLVLDGRSCTLGSV